jgi:uncharacterized small protein (DUF1192 family)
MGLRLKTIEELDSLGLPPDLLQKAKETLSASKSDSNQIPEVGDLSKLSESELWSRLEIEQREIKRLEEEVTQKQQYLTAARYRRGQLLIELKRRCKHGEFESMLKRHRIKSQRASEDRRIAEHYANEEDAGKVSVVEALKAIKRSGTVCDPYENCYACPQWVRGVIAKEFGLPGLDVSASHGMEFGERFYSPPGDPSGFKQDGLKQDWKKDCMGKVIWCNPPYHKKVIANWVEKAWREAQRGCVVLCMLPLWRSHGWFAEYVKAYAEVRISGAPVVLQGFGPQQGTRCGNVDSPFAYETIIAIFRKGQKGFINGAYMEPMTTTQKRRKA